MREHPGLPGLVATDPPNGGESAVKNPTMLTPCYHALGMGEAAHAGGSVPTNMHDEIQ